MAGLRFLEGYSAETCQTPISASKDLVNIMGSRLRMLPSPHQRDRPHEAGLGPVEGQTDIYRYSIIHGPLFEIVPQLKFRCCFRGPGYCSFFCREATYNSWFSDVTPPRYRFLARIAPAVLLSLGALRENSLIGFCHRQQSLFKPPN